MLSVVQNIVLSLETFGLHVPNRNFRDFIGVIMIVKVENVLLLDAHLRQMPKTDIFNESSVFVNEWLVIKKS
jgi:hypothetical protein